MISEITSLEVRNSFDGSLIYKNNEFEEKTNRTAYLKTRAQNDSKLWFLTENGTAIKSEYSEKRSCPICNSVSYQNIFNKDGFEHVKCDCCAFVFVSPVLTDDAIIKYYEGENNWTQVMLSDEEKRVNKIMYSSVFDFFEKNLGGLEKSIIDIGSGSGYFLEVGKELNWSVEGIELNKDMLSLAEKNGLNVSNKSLNEFIKNGEKFSVVSSWFVLEHIKNIEQFMEEMSQLVEKSGLLFIGVPQLDALVNRLYFKESPTFAGYSHINFFNKDSIKNFIEPFGFELVAQETQITQLNNIKKYFNRLGVSENSGLNEFINKLTPEYIHNNFLGSNLISVFRKK